MQVDNLLYISPIDGRYYDKVSALSNYFSEYALIKYRVFVEIQYLVALSKLNLKNLKPFTSEQIQYIQSIYQNFSINDAQRIKEIENNINHDVKAVEYFIKEKLQAAGYTDIIEFVHFGLTSQDINNTAIPLMTKDFLNNEFFALLENLVVALYQFSKKYEHLPMLAHTHGQPASPTTLGKELYVYVYRLQNQLNDLKNIPVKAKFGGATGNFNAHYVAYPDIDWHRFADEFIQSLGLERYAYTTQIENYDYLSALLDNCKRINTILIDFCVDVWMYIAINYFKQKMNPNEVGSSAMPHKVNPIDFENAEGNLKYANAIFNFLSEKLPVSRWQRDLTDSTVLRNIGVPFAHTVLSMKSILNGINKIDAHTEFITQELNNNWQVIAEAIQTVLRREKYPQPYEALKALTRGKSEITSKDILNFIEQLNVSEEIKQELKRISPQNYIGKNKEW
ncbi:MAG: adenylosuccinate lyase [Bacteroidetes bacterium]|jgi:adenylosuccinate lyase|nr:MAG: adenylosuccinate lyase [Bacteroidota bacterium]